MTNSSNLFRSADDSFQENDDLIIPLSMFENIKSTGKPNFYCDINGNETWEFVHKLTTSFSTVTYISKDAAPLLSPTVYQLIEGRINSNTGKPYQGYRCEQNATISGMAMLDFDECGLLYNDAVAWIRSENLEAVLYTTASNRIGDRFRMIIPFTAPVDIDTQKRTMRAIRRALGHDPDSTKMNPYSLFYVPGQYVGADNHYDHVRGHVRSAQEWCDGYPEPAKAPPAAEPKRRPKPSESACSWSFETHGQDLIDRYRSLSDGRYRGLSVLATAIAMSALNFGYKLTVSELASFLDQEQSGNRPTNHVRNWQELQDLASYGIDNAERYVTDPAYLKKKAVPEWAVRQTAEDVKNGKRSAADFLMDEDTAIPLNNKIHPEDPSKTCHAKRDPGSDDPTDEPPVEDVSHNAGAGPQWPEPINLFGNLTEPVLTKEMLPKVIADFVWEQAALLGCNPEPMAMAALTIMASLISDNVRLRPKRYEDYYESARLWLILVGDVSSKKTPMMKKLMRPVKVIANRMRQEDRLAMKAYKKEMESFKTKQTAWIKSEDDGFGPDEPERPPQRRLLTNDFTPEALARVLCDNPRGMLLELDEIMQEFGGFDSYRQSGAKRDRSLILQLWNGDGREIDRVRSEDDPIYVPNWGVSQLGGIQTDMLDQIGTKLINDGLLQRFMIQPMGVGREEVDLPMDPEIETDYRMLIENLVGFNPPPYTEQDGVIIRLSDAANEIRLKFQEIIQASEVLPGLANGLQEHMGKMGAIFNRLMLTLHMIETRYFFFDEEKCYLVSEDTAMQTYNIALKYLIPHAFRQYERLFSTAKDQKDQDVRWLAGHIIARNIDKVTIRLCHDAHRVFKKEPDRAEKAIKILIDANWLDHKNCVNPRVHEMFAERGKQERHDRDTKIARIEKAHRVGKGIFV